eukprot:538215-Rhodomonas_salina.2
MQHRVRDDSARTASCNIRVFESVTCRNVSGGEPSQARVLRGRNCEPFAHASNPSAVGSSDEEQDETLACRHAHLVACRHAVVTVEIARFLTS